MGGGGVTAILFPLVPLTLHVKHAMKIFWHFLALLLFLLPQWDESHLQWADSKSTLSYSLDLHF